MLWCVDKSRRGKITTIMDEPYYWKRIEQNQFREDFLTNLLTAAEENRNRASSERSAWALEDMSNEEAGECFFYYGNRDFSEGEIEGIWGTTATLFTTCVDIKTRSLPEYGQLFFQYFDGYHTASMVKFLRLQKKRLEAGEDISSPAPLTLSISTLPINDEVVDLRLPNQEPMSNEEKKECASQILAPLDGLNPQKQPIMTKTEFAQLIEYANHLVTTDTLPVIARPISQIAISNEHLRYTFYRLHKELLGTRRINQNYIEFLHSVFAQFSGTAPTTTKAKFSQGPSSYQTDFAGYIGEGS